MFWLLNSEERRKRKLEKEKKEYYEKQEKYDDKIRDAMQKHKFNTIMEKFKLNTYTKLIVTLIIVISLIDLQLSYVLAFLGSTQIAESLSCNICNTILGVSFIYIVRAYFDTRAEHKEQIDASNKDSNTEKSLDEMISDKVSTILSNAGIRTIDVDEDDDNVEIDE